jgi:hypothetical protein
VELLCGWDTFITASFIYWEAMQEGMDLARPGQADTTSGIITGPLQLSTSGGNLLQQEFEYKPGFQVGLGWNTAYDNWTLSAEYTWLHGSTHTSKDAPSPEDTSIDGVDVGDTGYWIPSSWLSGFYDDNATTHISSHWSYKIDYVDAQVSRPFYSGTHFTVEPFFGLRGAWIRQKLSVEADNVGITDVAAHPDEREANFQSRSSAIGPRIGLNGNWLLEWGFRFIGDASCSILFTGYDVKESIDSPDADKLPISLKMKDLNYLRPNVDLSLGLGWGSYFFCRRMHWDLSATYDFSVFFGQNMIRYLADITANTTSDASGAPMDLYLQGLTVKTRFDF